MGHHDLIGDYGMLHIIEMNIATLHSKIPEMDAALRETEKHLQAAEASLRTAVTFRTMEEK